MSEMSGYLPEDHSEIDPTDPNVIEQTWSYYFEPLETQVNLHNKKAKALAIHDSAPSVQAGIDGFMDEVAPGSFDRLALPNPAEKIADGPLPLEWAQVLESKHHFEEIHVFESDVPERRVAQTMIKGTFPELKVVVHQIEIDPEELAVDMAVQCSDLRFQEEYRQMMYGKSGGLYERLAFPGASLGIVENPVVLKWIKEAMARNGTDIIYLLDHIDCAIAGGLRSHFNHEYSEAEYHARAQHEAGMQIKALRPDKRPVIVPHTPGSEGKIGVLDIQRDIGLPDVNEL